MSEDNYMSLYDFLGKPAGGELGLEVATEASQRGVRSSRIDVDTSIISAGYVKTYPETFLKEYFYKEDPKDNIDTYDRDNFQDNQYHKKTYPSEITVDYGMNIGKVTYVQKQDIECSVPEGCEFDKEYPIKTDQEKLDDLPF